MNLPTNILPSNVYMFFFIVLAVVLALAVVLLVIYILSHREFKLLANSSKVKGTAIEEALKIVDEARVDAIRVLMESHKRAGGLVDEMRDINHEAKRELYSKLRGVYDKYLNEVKDLGEDLLDIYKSAVSEETKQGRELLDAATQEIKHTVAEQVRGFAQEMRKETFESEEKLEQMLKDKYSEVDKDIEEYRKNKLAKIHDSYLQILSEVYADVIGKQVGQLEGEKLILQMIKDKMKSNAL